MASANAPVTAAAVEYVESVLGSFWLASREAQVVATTWQAVLTTVMQQPTYHSKYQLPWLYLCFLLVGAPYTGSVAVFLLLSWKFSLLVPLLRFVNLLPFFRERLFRNDWLS